MSYPPREPLLLFPLVPSSAHTLSDLSDSLCLLSSTHVNLGQPPESIESTIQFELLLVGWFSRLGPNSNFKYSFIRTHIRALSHSVSVSLSAVVVDWLELWTWDVLNPPKISVSTARNAPIQPNSDPKPLLFGWDTLSNPVPHFKMQRQLPALLGTPHAWRNSYTRLILKFDVPLQDISHGALSSTVLSTP